MRWPTCTASSGRSGTSSSAPGRWKQRPSRSRASAGRTSSTSRACRSTCSTPLRTPGSEPSASSSLTVWRSRPSSPTGSSSPARSPSSPAPSVARTSSSRASTDAGAHYSNSTPTLHSPPGCCVAAQTKWLRTVPVAEPPITVPVTMAVLPSRPARIVSLAKVASSDKCRRCTTAVSQAWYACSAWSLDTPSDPVKTYTMPMTSAITPTTAPHLAVVGARRRTGGSNQACALTTRDGRGSPSPTQDQPIGGGAGGSTRAGLAGSRPSSHLDRASSANASTATTPVLRSAGAYPRALTSRNGYGYQWLTAPCANVYPSQASGHTCAQPTVDQVIRGRGPNSSQPSRVAVGLT